MLRKLIEVKFHYVEMQYFHTVLLLQAYLIMNLLFDIKFPVSRIRVKFELMPSSPTSLEWKKKKNSFKLSREKGKVFLHLYAVHWRENSLLTTGSLLFPFHLVLISLLFSYCFLSLSLLSRSWTLTVNVI